MSLSTLATLTLLIPAVTALLAGLSIFMPAKESARNRFAMGLTSGGLVVSAVFALILFYQIAMAGAPAVQVTLFNWLDLANTSLSFGVWVDKLTATMLLVVCGVSACVHVYSIGYMAEDPDKPRFFAYLSLFTFAMLALVTAPNLLQMFLGWEGVGLASYLLIGFWHQKESANAASMKAFITNRVSDAALLVGLFTLLATFGTLNYAELFTALPDLNGYGFTLFGWHVPLVEFIAACLFIGAMGKSAQLGFHVWLPDAMEGPTPVSALIHAATMVTAGVFLLCRMSPLFELAPHVLQAVAYIGALTAIFAATIGLTQKDIKRVIAYSTCSQLGYMFFAIGVSAYPAAMFHLTTHAFFKALLFLGAGSVIHALHHEQDLFKMGAVRTVLPITYGLMWIGSLALAGIPPFAGFFSKDLILEAAYGAHSQTGTVLYVLGTAGALLTAFYSFRVLFMAFHGKFRGEKDVYAHAHEAPKTMLIPMVVLGIGALLGGWLLQEMADLHWWQGALVIAAGHEALENAHHTPELVKLLPLALALAGIAVAALFYLWRTGLPAKLAKICPRGYALSLNKWYVDELYSKVLIQPLRRFSNSVWQRGDVRIIDGWGPNGVARLVTWVGEQGRACQTGYVYHYAFAIVAGLCLLLLWLSMSILK